MIADTLSCSRCGRAPRAAGADVCLHCVAEITGDPDDVATAARAAPRREEIVSESPSTGRVRPFAELRDSGLLWLVNASVFHPRGVGLALVFDDDGKAVGWQLLGGPDEPWHFEPGPEIDERFRAANRTVEEARR